MKGKGKSKTNKGGKGAKVKDPDGYTEKMKSAGKKGKK